MARNKGKPTERKVGGPSPAQIFMRRINASRDLRSGLAGARTSIELEKIPDVVRALGQLPVYRRLFAQTTFPKSLEKQTTKKRLESISVEGEIIWTASVLSLFEEQLKEYVSIRDKFYNAYFFGQIEKSIEYLDLIEVRFGISLWLVSHRFQILQQTEGLQSQKDYLEKIVSTKGIDRFFSFISYYLSLRAENGVTYESFYNQVSPNLGLSELGGYLISRILQYQVGDIENVGAIISWNEPHGVIDRYESFVMLGLLFFAKQKKSGKEILLKSFQLLGGIEDEIIKNILNIANGNIDCLTNAIEHCDQYTLGVYDNKVLHEKCNLEIIAKSHVLSGDIPVEGDSFYSKTIYLMCKVLNVESDIVESVDSLKKISLFFAGSSFSYQIMSFLERSNDFIFNSCFNNTDYITAIAGPLDNVWNSEIFSELSGVDWLHLISEYKKNSPAVCLRQGIRNRSYDVKCEIFDSIPEFRRLAYLGHISLLNDEYKDCIEKYAININSEQSYVRLKAYEHLFNAHYKSSNYIECMRLVVEHSLLNPSASFKYPLNEISKICMDVGDLKSDIFIAILLHISTRHGYTKYERDISDIYENYLGVQGVESPSQLIEKNGSIVDSKLIYFLRYVCVPRIMDDSTYFEGMDEIDDERIKVCQYLLKVDESNKNHYVSEIRQITKDRNVAQLLKIVQTSKIYVDEAGVRQSLEPVLKPLFTQYKELLNSPDLSYQAEKISRIIGDLLSGKGHPEFKELKLPATERESLFQTILEETVLHFALNPAYGLDTHVSTTIRHGSFEGNLRSPLAYENLLVKFSNNEAIANSGLISRLSGLSESGKSEVIKSLGKFTQKFEYLIQSYLKEKLHIQTPDKKNGMFIFEASPEKNRALFESITPSTIYEIMVDYCIDHCWELTAQSLNSIRVDLVENASSYMDSAFRQLVDSIEKTASHDDIVHLLDSVARAKTEFQAALYDIADWFQKPTDLVREPFELDSALDVALQQIRNCYLTTNVNYTLNKEFSLNLDGMMLDGLCEILFILLQNSIIHSGFENQDIDLVISFSYVDDCLNIVISNELGASVDITERRNTAGEAVKQYQQDTALKKARIEGGSGLSKIWRIAEYKLNVLHSISLEVQDARMFSASISLIGLMVSK